MTEFVFAPATKEQAKARIALDGPSGSGKTWSALSIGQGLGRRIAVIDTERGSASKYAGDFRFDTLQMHTYDPRDLVKALSAAAGAGFDVVIVDSLSHFWMGTGGMLEQVDGFAKRSNSGNSFAAWKDARPMEREMIDGLLSYPGHVIVTMRTKTEWVITENDRGRKEPRKIGLKAEQRDGIEYEFDIVGDLDLDHNLVVSKSRMSALADKVISRPSAELGAEILAWLSDGERLPSAEDYIRRAVDATTMEEVRAVYAEVQQRNLGAAPCMRGGQATTLRQFIIDRGTEFQPVGAESAPVAPQQPAVAPPPVREPEPAKSRVQRGPQDNSAWEQDAPAPESTKGQHIAISDLFRLKHGVTTRERKLAGVAHYLHHPVGSTTELSYADAAELIETLSKLPDYVPKPSAEEQREASAQAEAVKLAATDESESERIEQAHRESIESAADAGEVDDVLARVGEDVAKRLLGNAQRDALVRAAGQRKDALAADQGWAGQQRVAPQGVPLEVGQVA